jgi:ganglioside GM2 activator
MSLSSLKPLLILAVVLLSVANANIFDTMGDRLSQVVKNVRDEVRQGVPALEESVKRWSSLSASVKHMGIPMSLISPQEKKQAVLKGKLGDFNWQSCGPSDQLVDIRNLSITPSPLYFPGPLHFGFDIVFRDNIPADAKVSATLQLQYSSRGTVWVTIPCIGQIGSCTYDDVCSLSQAIPCPDVLKQKGIPCTCPFNKGEYVLPNFDVEIDASLFIAGQYRGKAVFTDSQKGKIACYQVTFTVG